MNETIGDYRLIDKIGEGAAGEVFLATPTKDKAFAKAGQLVAVKRYKPAILEITGQYDRIEREFNVGSDLSHPNLVRIFEYCSISNNTDVPYLVMEYIDGISLDRWIQQFVPLPRRLLSSFVNQLLRGVSHLHNNDIMHRDLKPENIMITSTFDAKIMDFGVVRNMTALKGTPSEMFVGTIRNSSPELLLGKDVDNRTDLYSLGTIFFALLHGKQVFDGEKQFARLVRMVEETDPHFDPGVAGQSDAASILFDVTKKLVQKCPKDRYATITEIQEKLESVSTYSYDDEPPDFLHGYVATALTGLDANARDAIMFASSTIAELCKEYDIFVYQPRKATDPLLNPDVDPYTVYKMDRKRVLAADVLFVFANNPSFGVGQEIEIATGSSIPTILIVREGNTVSRMVTGSPANIISEISYQAPEELDRKLRKSLVDNLDAILRWRKLASARERSAPAVGQRLAELRRRAGHDSISEFAESVGASSQLLEAFEQGEYQTMSLNLIDALASELGTSLSALTSSKRAKTGRPSAPKSNSSLRSLEATAKKLGWSAASYLELRDDYQNQLAAKGEASYINDSQWVQRHNKLDERRVAGAQPIGDAQKSLNLEIDE